MGVWAALLAAVACTEQVTAPGLCPNFCPGGQIDVRDTILLDAIERDSAFRGYVQPYRATFSAVADVPGVIDSRAIFALVGAIAPRVAPKAGDSTTVPIVMDSSRLQINIARRDTNTVNLYVKLYRLPLTIDSTSDFANLAPAFSGQATDSVSVDDLLARPVADSATKAAYGDTTVRVDDLGHALTFTRGDSTLVLYFNFDTLRIPFVEADSGKLAWGVRVGADTLASVLITSAGDRSPLIRWFHHFKPDSVAFPDSVINSSIARATSFHSFVFDPPNPAGGDDLMVGGAPAARSILRVKLPQFIRDSVDIVRATLILVPSVPATGAASDSFAIEAKPVLTDLGAKSPLSTITSLVGSKTIHINSMDTVRIELTNLLRFWKTDTTLATTFFLSTTPGAEASSYVQVGFHSSRSTPFKPSLEVTYVKRFPFGAP